LCSCWSNFIAQESCAISCRNLLLCVSWTLVSKRKRWPCISDQNFGVHTILDVDPKITFSISSTLRDKAFYCMLHKAKYSKMRFATVVHRFASLFRQFNWKSDCSGSGFCPRFHWGAFIPTLWLQWNALDPLNKTFWHYPAKVLTGNC